MPISWRKFSRDFASLRLWDFTPITVLKHMVRTISHSLGKVRALLCPITSRRQFVGNQWGSCELYRNAIMESNVSNISIHSIIDYFWTVKSSEIDIFPTPIKLYTSPPPHKTIYIGIVKFKNIDLLEKQTLLRNWENQITHSWVSPIYGRCP